MLERLFKLQDNRASVKGEAIAGVTTFAAMAYILVVHPDMLSQVGMDRGALLTSTAIVAAIGTLLMALLTNYPIALAPGMGLNAFFTYSICLDMGVPWQGALGMVFWTGILFILLSVTGLRSLIVDAIPETLKLGTQAGIGLFIAVIGFQNAGIVIDHPATLVSIGPLSNGLVPNSATLAILGLFLAVILMIRKVPGAILISIGIITLVGLFIPGENGTLTPHPEGVVGLPASPAPVFLQVDWFYPFTHWESAWIIVLSFLFVDLFDSMGTLIAVSRQAGLTDKQGNLPKMPRALLADAMATAAGACFGSSPVTAYIESATGVQAGGKTGLTATFVAICFLLALIFAPLILAIPSAATAPALILVGIFMLAGLRRLNWDDLAGSAPGVLTAMLIPLGFSIANGIAIGCIAYTVLMYGTNRPRNVHWLLTVLSILFVLKFIFAAES